MWWPELLIALGILLELGAVVWAYISLLRLWSSRWPNYSLRTGDRTDTPDEWESFEPRQYSEPPEVHDPTPPLDARVENLEIFSISEQTKFMGLRDKFEAYVFNKANQERTDEVEKARTETRRALRFGLPVIILGGGLQLVGALGAFARVLGQAVG